MSRILGVDLSLTASGWCHSVDGKIVQHGLAPGKGLYMDRLIYVRNRICEKVDEFQPDLVVFEDLSFGSKGQAVHEHAGLAFMIRAEMVQDKRKYCLIAPSSLKKFVCGTAGSPKNPMKKEHMLKFLATRFHHDVNENNIGDAIGLTYIGMALMGDWECQIEPQREVIKKIRESNPSLKQIEVPTGDLW